MKVRFLGTGAAEGLPALFCNCGICGGARSRGGRDLRFRTTALIDDTIRIDLPPDSLAQLHAYPELSLNKIKQLLFTHSDDDHFAVRELQYLSPTFAPSRTEALEIWGTAYVLDLLRQQMLHFFDPAPVKLRAMEPFCSYDLGHLTITPITAHHKETELCLNYLVTETETGKTLLYASDTGWYDPPTWNYLMGRRLDMVILECGLGAADGGYDGHLSLNACIAVRERLISGGGLLPTALFYLTHISHTGLLLHDQLVERAAPHRIDIAYDGLEILI